jgi:TatD DNase family protein
MWFETHCHVHSAKESHPYPEETIQRSLDAGVSRIIVVGTDPADWECAVRFAERFECVWAIVGWHPTSASKFTDSSLQTLAQWLEHPKVVAVGEIGLDYYWDFSTPEEQIDALLPQLDLAIEYAMPVVFHAREATAHLLAILETRPPMPYLFHCFSGTTEEFERAYALGSRFGVDGPLTYKKNEGLRDWVRTIPRDRLVLETDSPYLSPEPYRSKPNSPENIPIIGAKVAELWATSLNEVAQITTQNANEFFRL